MSHDLHARLFLSTLCAGCICIMHHTPLCFMGDCYVTASSLSTCCCWICGWTSTLFPSLDSFEYFGYECFVCEFFGHTFNFGSSTPRGKIIGPRDGEKAQLLLRKTQVWFPTSTWWLTGIHRPSPREFVVLFLPLKAPGTCMLHRNTHQ